MKSKVYHTMNSHQVSPNVLRKLRERLIDIASYSESEQKRIMALSDDDLVEDATQELRRLHWIIETTE